VQDLEEAFETMSNYYFDLRNMISATNIETTSTLNDTADGITEKVNSLRSIIAAGSVSMEDAGVDDKMDTDRSKKRKKSVEGGLLNNVIGESLNNNDSITTQTQTQDIDLGWFEKFSLSGATPIFGDSTHAENQLPTPPIVSER